MQPITESSVTHSLSGEEDRFAKHDAGRLLLSEAFNLDGRPVVVKNTFIHVDIPPSSSKSAIGSIQLPQKWQTAPAIVQERSFKTLQAALEQAHRNGTCKPCAYYYYKADGCRMGSQCLFCHLCTRGEIRRRKKERTRMLRHGALPGEVQGQGPGEASAAAAHASSDGDVKASPRRIVVRTAFPFGSESPSRWEEMKGRVVDSVNEVKDGLGRVVKRVTGDLARTASGRGSASPKPASKTTSSSTDDSSHSLPL